MLNYMLVDDSLGKYLVDVQNTFCISEYKIIPDFCLLSSKNKTISINQ